MDYMYSVNVSKFIYNLDWSTVPTLNDIAVYLSKSDTIELSQACKHFRSKLSSRVFYKLTLFNQVYWNYRQNNNVVLRGNKLKKLICEKIIEDLASKSRLVKKVVLTSRINPKLANLFFKKFKYCKSVIIDCKYEFKLATVYNILKHLNYLEVFFMEALYKHSPNGALIPSNFRFPKTLKSITVYPYILENNYIPAINDIDFATHYNITHWQITGSFNTERLSHQQPNITHLYLRDMPTIEFDKFKSTLVNNPQLKTLLYNLEFWSIEKLNTILTLPNLQKLLVANYEVDSFNYTNFSLISNTTIKTLILSFVTPSIVIEELLTKLESLEDVIFIGYCVDYLEPISWLQFQGKLNSITFAYIFDDESEIENLVSCLKPQTKILFNYSVKSVVNYNLTI
ncbi:hypothetical protein CONCODRAFT_10992 [Conidiobolus coronatus NRRL 28638]|uniref:F-box domain-containing protein n=1 Tax=Conidiobolus coronatus (strain ATCC 28846 / CBS 209.66 / NRRL 28638) TaxID=796925 RepID=A0A137NW14_CONC2|nr:hypothetical protein CONCODRAFT_10992 [Conidiobolus coronatus NRRL 28638]|eukprot:KXN67010.1 hypothetical protein CONCODRAFT_10992 [Conidiobolus coronatus NRRL 28638]